MKETKFIFVTGGVCSSLGKGLTAASMGTLLEKKGYKIALIKLDPYLNVDPGTMSPFQHGEVYVTDDGAETDLDLGHYYRFTHSPLSKASNATSGQIYDTVIRRERKGDYLGKTVQVIPHITNEIKRRIEKCAQQEEDIQIVIVEIGGTVGDIESLPFLEAIRQFQNEHRGSCITAHLTYVPLIPAAGEVKTKPTQHSVQMLRQIGLIPDIILCRCQNPIDDDVKEKIALFCDVSREAVIEIADVSNTIYEVPLKLHSQKIDSMLCEKLNLCDSPVAIEPWKNLVHSITHPKHHVKLACMGKYVQLQDAYKSLYEAIHHGGIPHSCQVEIVPFEADKYEDAEELKQQLLQLDGILVPGGYGERGWEGKILACQIARENQIPYFGICLGMQVLCVEFARHLANLKEANSTEIDPKTADPLISLLKEQKSVTDYGGTMRLGAYPCHIQKDSLAYKTYATTEISERHRHRYEFNNHYRKALEEKGLRFSGIYPEKDLVEIVEAPNHPWMLGVQYHPEFQSKPTAPHPLFVSYAEAMIQKKQSK